MQRVHAWLILALWLLWCVFWLAASLRAKATARRESPASRISHSAPLLIAVLLYMGGTWQGGWLHARFLSHSDALFWLGTAMVVVGLGWSVLARAHLGGNWSAEVTVKRDHVLIRTGPYRWTRHPIYTGLLVAFAGSTVALGEWRGLIALALVIAAFLHKIRIEERFMMEQFPGEYPRYRAEVPTLIPRRFLYPHHRP